MEEEKLVFFASSGFWLMFRQAMSLNSISGNFFLKVINSTNEKFRVLQREEGKRKKVDFGILRF